MYWKHIFMIPKLTINTTCACTSAFSTILFLWIKGINSFNGFTLTKLHELSFFDHCDCAPSWLKPRKTTQISVNDYVINPLGATYTIFQLCMYRNFEARITEIIVFKVHKCTILDTRFFVNELLKTRNMYKYYTTPIPLKKQTNKQNSA